MTRIMIIVGSVRDGRKGIAVAEWLRARVETTEGVEIDFVDLKELELPLMTEPEHPVLGRYSQPATIAWSRRVAAADAFIIVAPEYNHSYTAPVKNALDYLVAEWRRKAIGFASYGGTSGGTRAVAALAPAIVALGLVKTKTNVEIPGIADRVENGIFIANEPLEQALREMTAELMSLAEGLRPLR